MKPFQRQQKPPQQQQACTNATPQFYKPNGDDTSKAFASSSKLQETLTPSAEKGGRGEGGGQASILNLSISLIKSIVASGVFCLPAGIACLGNAPASVIGPALLLVGAFGAMNAYFFTLIGSVCNRTGATRYRDAWEKTIGPASSSYVNWVVLLKAALGNLAYSMILADSFQSMATAAGFQNLQRTPVLITMTVTALLPLCLLKDLTSLAPFSLLGIVGIVFSAGAMLVRLLDGTYSVPDGRFLADIPVHLQPNLRNDVITVQSGSIVLACTLATAFVAHYNAPRFHAELYDNTPQRFQTVTSIAFLTAAVLMGTIAVTGYLTFGTHADGYIINNYSAFDPFILLSRVAIAMSLLFTYPLPFVGFRDGVMDMLKMEPEQRTDRTVTLLSIALLSMITVCACLVTDLGLVLAVGGGTFSTAVSSIFPPLMYRASVRDSTDPRERFHAQLSTVLMVICGAVGITGATTALLKAMK